MSIRAPPPSESRGDDGDRDAKTFPRAHIIEGVEFAKFPKMPSIGDYFFYFAKFSRMTTSFSKFLEIILK